MFYYWWISRENSNMYAEDPSSTSCIVFAFIRDQLATSVWIYFLAFYYAVLFYWLNSSPILHSLDSCNCGVRPYSHVISVLHLCLNVTSYHYPLISAWTSSLFSFSGFVDREGMNREDEVTLQSDRRLFE